MLKFFRQIRQRLLTENKFSKYLVYASGEILLVMIGILLALQVNNWNERRNQHQLEQGVLQEMVKNLEQDLEDLEYNIKLQNRFIHSNQIVLTQLDKQTPYHDSLEYHYGNLWGSTLFTKNTSAFDNLKSMGFNIISNDSIRMKITHLYSARYDYLTNIEQIENKFQFDQFHPTFRKNVRMDKLWEKAYPIAPQALADNHEFKELIRFNITTNQFVTNIYKGLILDIQELMELINTELNP